MLPAILNKSWRKHPTKHQLYSHLPPIMKTNQVRRIRHAGHCWRSSDELVSEVLQRTPTYSRAKAGRPARTYIQQLCEDTGCSPEDLPEGLNDREKWRERVRDIRASGTTSWWWWWWIIYDLKKNFLKTFLNESELIFLPTVKWFQVLICNSNNLISVICLHIFKWIFIPRGVMVKAMDYGIVVSEFVLQSRYYVHFRANTLVLFSFL